MLTSTETQRELHRVLSKPYFQRIITDRIRRNIDVIFSASEHVEIIETVTACRDRKDDKFLELAVNGNADIIVSGDKDLLTMKIYNGIPIVTPAEFLNAFHT